MAHYIIEMKTFLLTSPEIVLNGACRPVKCIELLILHYPELATL